MTNIKRKNNIHLPRREELREILEKEAFRPCLKEKEEIHYPEFSSMITLLERYDLPTMIFTDNSLDVYDVVEGGISLLDKLVKRVYGSKLTDKQKIIFNNMYDYLSEEDILKKADLIFVFGGKTILRAEKALEVYRKRFAKKIFVSGGNPVYFNGDNKKSESQVYKEFLIENGVLESDIYTEDQSITLPDNVWHSLDLFERDKLNIKSLILVNSPYTQRRGWTFFKKYLPDEVKIYRVNSDCKEEYKKENWFKKEETFRIIVNEFIKMRASVVYNTA